MRKFTANYIIARSFWLPLSVVFLVLTEQSIKDTFLGIIVTSLFILMLLLENIIGYNKGRVALRNSMNLSILLYFLGGILYYFEISIGVIVVFFLLLLLNRRSSNNMYHMLSFGILHNNKPKVNRAVTFIVSVIILSIFTVTVLTNSILYLYLIGIVMLLSSKSAFQKCALLWDTHSTTNFLIKSEQQKNAQDVANYGKTLYKLKDSLKIKGLIRITYIYILIIFCLPLLLTIYRPEERLTILTFFVAGYFIAATSQSYIISRVRVSYMIQHSIIFIGSFCLVVYKEASGWYLAGLAFLIGTVYFSIMQGVPISIQQNVKISDIPKQVKAFSVISKILPVISVTITICFYKYVQTDYVLIGIMFICITTVLFLSTIRLFRPKVKEMTYIGYK